MEPVYLSLDEFPPEEPDPALDGDDGELESWGGAAVPGAPEKIKLPELLASLARRGRIVPFVRPVERGMVGKDVLAVKRALKAAGELRRGNLVPWFGPRAVMGLKRFQRRSGLKPDGVYGRATHAKLAPFIDAYGVWLLHQVTIIGSPERQQRLRIRGAALLTWHHAAEVHYTQGPRRMSGVRGRLRPPHFGQWEDCSSMATWLHFAARAPDPNGEGYNLIGYTGTIDRHCRRTASPTIGSMALYGDGWPYKHVATVIGHNAKGPVVHSHGSEGGPYIANAKYRSDLAHYVDGIGG